MPAKYSPSILASVRLRIKKRTNDLLDYQLTNQHNQVVCDTRATGGVIEFRDWRERPYAWVDIDSRFRVFVQLTKEDKPMRLGHWLVEKERKIGLNRLQREVTVGETRYTWGCTEKEELVVSIVIRRRGHL